MTRKEHHEWQRRVAKRLPEAAARVFALRGRNYTGSGFHWSLERTLGRVIVIANDFERPYEAERDRLATQIVDEVIVEGFFADLSKAERSVS